MTVTPILSLDTPQVSHCNEVSSSNETQGVWGGSGFVDVDWL